MGRTFADRYQIVALIGEGGFGVVYKARHTLIGRTVAIKVLHERAADDASLRRFRLEAQAAAGLTHPNIVAVYDFGAEDASQLYLIMDYVEGTSLAELLYAEGHLEVLRALNIFIQTCEALEHAHRRGIIHRDLKPSNIMLARDETEGDFVKIVDFGLAKLIVGDGQSEKLTQTGELLGTPLYMSPEQCRGDALDARSDIYSLGCIMYEALSGRLPICGKNTLSTLYQHISCDPLPFASAAPEIRVPQPLERIVFKALHKNPAARYQSMAELARELRRVRSALTAGDTTVRIGRSAFEASGLAVRRLGVAAGIGVVVLGVIASVLTGNGATRMSLDPSRHSGAESAKHAAAGRAGGAGSASPSTSTPAARSRRAMGTGAGPPPPAPEFRPKQKRDYEGTAVSRAKTHSRSSLSSSPEEYPLALPVKRRGPLRRKRLHYGPEEYPLAPSVKPTEVGAPYLKHTSSLPPADRYDYEPPRNFSAAPAARGEAPYAAGFQADAGGVHQGFSSGQSGMSDSSVDYEGTQLPGAHRSNRPAVSAGHPVRDKRGDKHARVARAIGELAEDYVAPALVNGAEGVGSASYSLGRKVGKYGRLLKELVEP
ncbi:MAG TPA: serine/threonine-protein kinase [Candidatus Obscuribacterales bacterium]